jgi:hypothetical protein
MIMVASSSKNPYVPSLSTGPDVVDNTSLCGFSTSMKIDTIRQRRKKIFTKVRYVVSLCKTLVGEPRHEEGQTCHSTIMISPDAKQKCHKRTADYLPD